MWICLHLLIFHRIPSNIVPYNVSSVVFILSSLVPIRNISFLWLFYTFVLFNLKNEKSERGGGHQLTINAYRLSPYVRTGIVKIVCAKQCCGSITFWRGFGSADPCLWLMDPDPAIFFIDLQDIQSLSYPKRLKHGQVLFVRKRLCVWMSWDGSCRQRGVELKCVSVRVHSTGKVRLQ
jgi:hypothetical protein